MTCVLQFTGIHFIQRIITHQKTHACQVTQTHTPHIGTHTHSINVFHSNKLIKTFMTHSNSSPSGELSIVSEGSSAAYENRYVHTHVHTCHTPCCSAHTVQQHCTFIHTDTYTYNPRIFIRANVHTHIRTLLLNIYTCA